MTRYFWGIPAALAGVLLGAVWLLVGSGDTSAATSYLWTFDGQPTSPESFYYDPNFDVQVHSRDSNTWQKIESFHAHHGPGCESPLTGLTHVVTEYEQTVFNCRDHMMTAINASGYGMIYFTPNHMVDFSNGEAVIRVDVSTLKTSQRDWWDIWITPWDKNLTLPLEDWLADGRGEPANAVHIRLGAEMQMCAGIITNHQRRETGSCKSWIGYNSFLQPDPSRRDTFEVRISRNHLKVGMPAYNFWWEDTSIPDLGWTQGVVQFGHHSYNPTKDGAGEPNTWHWDNVQISPARPFTIIRATQRTVQNNGTVTFAAPAPQNARLRFSAIGTVDVSFDGGKTWSRAQKSQQELAKAEHFSSYWTPVPAGTTQVQFRFSRDSWYEGPFLAKDFAFWSLDGSSVSPAPTKTATVQPTSTAPAQPTNTAIPRPSQTATATPTKTATPAPTKTATATPTKTATPNPTKTATPTPTKTATPVPTQTATPPPSNTQPGTRIKVNGQDWFLNGANLPWYNWGCDFGCGSDNGVSKSANRTAIGNKLNEASKAGLKTIRWWMFPGDPWQITRDSSGKPTGINPAVYQDIDAALQLAEQNDVYFNFVFFSAPSSMPSSWLNNATHRQALADVLGQLAARYRNSNRIIAWEIVNEPEWDIWGGKVQQKPVQDTVRAIANAINGATPAYVTVGSAMLDGLPMWKGMGLDFYQAHWYDYMQSGDWCAICTDYNTVRSRYGLDAPLVIGEFFAGPSINARDRLESLYNKGYAGAWSWSLFTNKTSDGMVVDLQAASQFASAHSDVGPRSGGSSATATATLTSSPTATKTATPTATRTSTPSPTKTATATRTPTPSATKSPTPAPTKSPTATPTRPWWWQQWNGRTTYTIHDGSGAVLAATPDDWICDVKPTSA